MGFVSSSRTGSRWAIDEARAISRASRAILSASSGSSSALELKPHAPSTRTRIPRPALRFELAASRAPFFTVSASSSRSTTRTSAYAAPPRWAASRARSIRSFTSDSSRGWKHRRQRLLDGGRGLRREIAPGGGHREVGQLLDGELRVDRLLEETQDAARALDRRLQAVG